jgi:hypothetical protein
VRVLPEFGRTNVLLLQEGGCRFELIRPLRTDCLLPRSIGNAFRFFVDVRLIHPLSGFRKSISCEDGFNHQTLMPASG